VYDDTAFGLSVSSLGGFELVYAFGDPDAQEKVDFWDHVSLGLTNDYGYLFGPGLEFSELAPEGAEEGDPAVSLGTASLGGFMWRVGLLLRYDL
jgi:hypothetical protein